MSQIENIEIYENGNLVSSSQVILTQEDILRLETEKYHIRKSDGEASFLLFAANLRLKKLSGEIDENTFNVIEELLLPVRSEIVLGQWKTALKKLQELNPQSIGVDLYTSIETTITTYISTNY